MGVVYIATHMRLERKVALKVISPALAGDESFRDRFKRESRTAASLRHPHVVTIHDAGEDQGMLYITMEYVEGTDLRSLIRSTKGMPPEDAARLIKQVGSALDAAHAGGLVHRDVKPANVLVQGEGEDMHAFLTDFGLTRHVTSVGGVTKTGTWVGTLDYVAPEQLRGEFVDARADTYALTAVLFEAVTGEVPYPRENDLAKMYAQVNDPPPELTERMEDADPRLAEVIKRGMAKDPDDRFPSVGDLAEAAQAAIQDREIRRPERSVAEAAAAPRDIPGVTSAAAAGATAAATPKAEPEKPVEPKQKPTPEETVAAIQPAGDVTRESDTPPPISDSERATHSLADSDTPVIPADKTKIAGTGGDKGPGKGDTGGTAVRGGDDGDGKRKISTPLLAVGAVVAGLVALGAGVAIAGGLGGGSESETKVSASSGPVTLRFGSDWQRNLGGGRPITGLRLGKPLAIDYAPQSGAGILRAGTSENAAAGTNPLPTAVAKRFKTPPKAESVAVGNFQGLFYEGESTEGAPGGGGGSVQVLMVPTSKGYIAAGCETSRKPAAFNRSCMNVLTTLQISGATPELTGPDPALAKKLSGIINTTQGDQKKAKKGLDADKAETQAKAANELADVYKSAAKQVGSIDANLRDQAAVNGLRRAFSDLSDAYSALAGAAKSVDEGAYADAEDDIKVASKQLDKALGNLEKIGYG